MKPSRGRIYALDPELGAQASAGLVLSEDDWNHVMRDSVIVPLYDDVPKEPTALRPEVAGLFADCTRVGGIEQDVLVEDRGEAAPEQLQAVVDGVRLYLDLENLQNPSGLRRPPSVGRTDWWPRRGEVLYGHRFGEQREIYGVITDDEWNVRGDYATCAFITSKFKTWRDRWQVPVRGGYAITGDIEPFAYVELDQRNRPPTIKALTRDELAAFGRGLELTLEL